MFVGLIGCHREAEQTPDVAPPPKATSEVKPPMKIALAIEGEPVQAGDERAVANLEKQYAHCEAIALEHDASLPASVTLVVTIGTNGNVTEAAGDRPTAPSSGMDCLVDETKLMPFPEGPKRTLRIKVQRE